MFIGNSFDITKNFSFGANLNYLFGRLEETNTLIVSNAIDFACNTQQGKKQQISGFSFSLGLNYRLYETENTIYTLGLTGAPKLSVNAKETFFAGTTTGDNIWSVDDNRFIDTLSFYDDKPVKTDWPATISIGLGRTKINKNNASFDYTFTHWKATSYENTRNSHRVAFGYSIIPQWNSPVKYFKRVTYRIGTFYENTNIIINNTGINNYSLTCGFGLPVRRGLYNCDIDFQAGRLGIKTDNNITDTYFRINFKIRFSELWFYKPKYD
jgi:hypothetical protein